MSLNWQFISRIAFLRELRGEKNPSTKPMRMDCPVTSNSSFTISNSNEINNLKEWERYGIVGGDERIR
jgi:hypothetical protein